jgi:putative Holliday junction resolvase
VSRPPRTFLGFDYGSKRIGVAVGQDLTASASALTTLATSEQSPPWQAIEQLIQQWQPQAFVVGLPYNKDGSEHAVTRAARQFGQQLQARFQRPVYWVDERLTSSEAESILAQRNVKRENKGRKGAAKADIDKLAAQLILQSWLDQQAGKP